MFKARHLSVLARNGTTTVSWISRGLLELQSTVKHFKLMIQLLRQAAERAWRYASERHTWERWGFLVVCGAGALAIRHARPMYRFCRAQVRACTCVPRAKELLVQYTLLDWNDPDAPAVKPCPSQATATELAIVRISPVQLSDQAIKYRAFLRPVSGNASEEPLTWRAVLRRWECCDTALGAELRRVLGSCPFHDFFWEACPVSWRTLDTPFEFVVIDATGFLNRRPASSQLFDKYLALAVSDGSLAAAFLNLGRDAMLIAPTNEAHTAAHAYGHLASFVRWAPPAQQDELWRVVCHETRIALQADPEATLWLNTDGRGVPWLHIRLDEAPKYIKHRQYRENSSIDIAAVRDDNSSDFYHDQ